MNTVKPFYINTKGARVFAINQQQSAGSQLQAGARSEISDNPLLQSLTTFGGRIAARTMQYMYRGNTSALRNYVTFRPIAMKYAVQKALGKERRRKIVLNPAGGYSPLFYQLAHENPQVRFYEFDTQKVIADKKRILNDFAVPKNLRLHAVNLDERNLHEIAANRIDVLMALGAYVTHTEYREMLTYAQHILKENGMIVAAFPYRPGIENFLENSLVFSKIVTQPIGVVDSEKDIDAIFRDTGYEIQGIVKLSQLAARYNYPIPADIEVIVVAKLCDSQRATLIP